jgi:hypothetical protein
MRTARQTALGCGQRSSVLNNTILGLEVLWDLGKNLI